MHVNHPAWKGSLEHTRQKIGLRKTQKHSPENQDCHSRKKPPLVPLPCIWVAKFGRGRPGIARPEHIRRHYFSPLSPTKVFHLGPKSTAFYIRFEAGDSSQGISFMFGCINFRFANEPPRTLFS